MLFLISLTVVAGSDVEILAVVDETDRYQELEERYESGCTNSMTQVLKHHDHRFPALPWEFGQKQSLRWGNPEVDEKDELSCLLQGQLFIQPNE